MSSRTALLNCSPTNIVFQNWILMAIPRRIRNCIQPTSEQPSPQDFLGRFKKGDPLPFSKSTAEPKGKKLIGGGHTPH